MALYPGQHLLESWVLGPEREGGGRLGVQGGKTETIMRYLLCVFLLGHSHQPLQGPLLVDLVGAVRDVGIEVRLSVPVNDVADVIDHYVLLVPFLQFLKEPKHRIKKGLGMSGIHTEHGNSSSHTHQIMTHPSNMGDSDRSKVRKAGSSTNTLRLNPPGRSQKRNSPPLKIDIAYH